MSYQARVYLTFEGVDPRMPKEFLAKVEKQLALGGLRTSESGIKIVNRPNPSSPEAQMTDN